MNGYGIQIDIDGSYEGYFKDGQKHGRGILIQNDEIIDGIWENGELKTENQNS